MINMEFVYKMRKTETIFEKKLKESICNRVISKEISFSSNKVIYNLIINDIKRVGDKYHLYGLRSCGFIDFENDPEKRKEIADIEYKQTIDSTGNIVYYLYNSVWTVILSKLKHFGIGKEDVEIIGKIFYIKMKRFFKHSQLYRNKKNTK